MPPLIQTGYWNIVFMKTFFNVIGCVVVVAVAAFVGQSAGFFKVPAIDDAGPYGTGVVTWAKGGFKGSPLAPAVAGQPDPVAVEATRAKAEMSQLIAESKRRAIAKYPDLAVANTEMNSRFVFRYNWMVKEGNALLQEATWPEQLAEDCAKAAKVTAKSLKSPVVSTKKMMASAAQ